MAAILDGGADILKRTYLCQVSDTGSPEPLVYILSTILPDLQLFLGTDHLTGGLWFFFSKKIF
jgi:hypothetical protein